MIFYLNSTLKKQEYNCYLFSTSVNLKLEFQIYLFSVYQ